MCVICDLDKISAFLQIIDDKRPGLLSLHSPVFLRNILIERSIGIEKVYRLEIMSLTAFPVVRIMSWRDLYHTGTEFHVDESVSDDWYASVSQRQKELLAYDTLVSFVIRVYCDSDISEHRLRTCRRNSDVSRTICIWILHIIELSWDVLILDLVISKRSTALRAVIDKIHALIDETTLIKRYESFPYSS